MKKLRAALAVLLTLTLVFGLAGCGEKGPDVKGKYLCVGETYDLPSGYTEPWSEGWIEITGSGKGVFFCGFECDMKWKLDGEAFTGTYEFLGISTDFEGTLKNGVIEIKYGDMYAAYALEGADTSGLKFAEGEPEGSEGGLTGTFVLYSLSDSEGFYDYAALKEMGLADGSYVTFNGDSTGVFCIAGEDPEDVTFDEVWEYMYDESGNEIGYVYSEGSLTFWIDDSTLVFVAEDSDLLKQSSSGGGISDPEPVDVPSGSGLDAGTLDLYLGDWHGMSEYYNCTGIFEEDNGSQCEILARILIDDNGNIIPYIAMAFGESEYNYQNLSLEYNAENECFDLRGTFLGFELLEGSIVSSEDGVLYINANVDLEDGDLVSSFACLRPLDAQYWTEDDYPYMPEDGVEFYAGMSFEEIAEFYELDVNNIPAAG